MKTNFKTLLVVIFILTVYSLTFTALYFSNIDPLKSYSIFIGLKEEGLVCEKCDSINVSRLLSVIKANAIKNDDKIILENFKND